MQLTTSSTPHFIFHSETTKTIQNHSTIGAKKSNEINKNSPLHYCQVMIEIIDLFALDV